VAACFANPGIVRHRGKIAATITNARAWQEIEARERFDQFLWKYIDGVPLQNHWVKRSEMPAQTDLPRQISKYLKQAGFTFCGPTIFYAFLQATGLINDHLVNCPRHAAVAAMPGPSGVARQ